MIKMSSPPMTMWRMAALDLGLQDTGPEIPTLSKPEQRELLPKISDYVKTIGSNATKRMHEIWMNSVFCPADYLKAYNLTTCRAAFQRTPIRDYSTGNLYRIVRSVGLRSPQEFLFRKPVDHEVTRAEKLWLDIIGQLPDSEQAKIKWELTGKPNFWTSYTQKNVSIKNEEYLRESNDLAIPLMEMDRQMFSEARARLMVKQAAFRVRERAFERGQPPFRISGFAWYDGYIKRLNALQPFLTASAYTGERRFTQTVIGFCICANVPIDIVTLLFPAAHTHPDAAFYYKDADGAYWALEGPELEALKLFQKFDLHGQAELLAQVIASHADILNV